MVGGMSNAKPWQAHDDGVKLRIKANPRASRNAIKGIVLLPDGPALAVAITAPPADGAANIALIDAMAKWLGVPRGSLTLLQGSSARIKRLHIAGDAMDLIERLESATVQCNVSK